MVAAAGRVNLSAVSEVLLTEMAEKDEKHCPYCAEPIKAAATLCPHCRSRIQSASAPDAYRNRAGRQIGGVSIALAEAFGISVTFVRLAFIILTFISFIGPPLYLALWLLLPAEPGGISPLGRFVSGDEGGPSILERVIRTTEDLFARVAAWFRGDAPPSESDNPKTPDGPDTPAEGAP